jgi:threonine synthase
MEESGGYGVASEDEEIVEGIKLLAESEGIFAETAGGVVISGLKKLALEGKIAPDEVTVAYITGAGLKTQEAIEDALELPLHIDPTMASFEEKLGERVASRDAAAAV